MSPDHKFALPPGTRLRQCRIVRLLGHGGFGLTYLAEDTRLRRKVAIKELLPTDFAVREEDGTTVVAPGGITVRFSSISATRASRPA